jgi:Arc/MetJ-type ribon-helix-helix transcriptional regulator
MAYQFPPDVEKLVNEQMSASGYSSQDDVLRDALQVLRELLSRRDQLLSDVQIGIEQANQGRFGRLDVNELIDRCTRKLAEEGIVD